MPIGVGTQNSTWNMICSPEEGGLTKGVGVSIE